MSMTVAFPGHTHVIFEDFFLDFCHQIMLIIFFFSTIITFCRGEKVGRVKDEFALF